MMSRLRVLHVDDDPESLALVRLILDGEPDVRLYSCVSVVEARRVAATTHLDVLLLDVMMPVADGPTLLAEFRTWPWLRDAAALFVTARVHPRDLEELAHTSASGVIRKPFEPMELVSRLRASVAAVSH